MSHSTKTQDRNRESNRKYFAKMSEEERKAFFRTRYQRYKSTYKEQSKRWAKDNPFKAQAAVHNARVRKQYPEVFAESEITNPELAVWLSRHHGTPCPYCGLPSTHIEHTVSLAKGGQHSWDNLSMACEKCNLMKRDYDLTEWLNHIKLIASRL